MTGKTKSLYKYLLREVKEAALRINLELRLEIIITDCELAAIKAFECHYPNADNKISLFHFGQALFRKFVDLGFKSVYENNLEVKIWFYSQVIYSPKFHQTKSPMALFI